jgi:hypothetical protein
VKLTTWIGSFNLQCQGNPTTTTTTTTLPQFNVDIAGPSSTSLFQIQASSDSAPQQYLSISVSIEAKARLFIHWLCFGDVGPSKPLPSVERITIRLALPNKGQMAKDTLGLMKVVIFLSRHFVA